MPAVRVFPDHEAMSAAAAAWLADRVYAQPDALLCAASGDTPTRTYELFAATARSRPGLAERLRLVKLDEWGGLADDDPATCEQHLQGVLVEPLAAAARYVGFASSPADPAAECARLARWLAEHGPLDLCVLGLGVNGHLGFNEPAEALAPNAHVACLSTASLGHAMLSSGRGRPTYGLTLGMADLLQARRVLLVASGPSKREPLARLLSGEIRTDFPASFLWLHPATDIYCDAAARPNGS